jgi:hypothetical protein
MQIPQITQSRIDLIVFGSLRATLRAVTHRLLV